MTINDLWKQFNKLDLEEQNYILKEYCAYVDQFPEEHEPTDYPATFLEWWINDYKETKEL